MLLLISKEVFFFGFKFIKLSLKELDFLNKGIKLYFWGRWILSINLNKFARRYPGSIKFIRVTFSRGHFIMPLEVDNEGLVVVYLFSKLVDLLFELWLGSGKLGYLLFKLCDGDLVLVKFWIEVELLLLVLLDWQVQFLLERLQLVQLQFVVSHWLVLFFQTHYLLVFQSYNLLHTSNLLRVTCLRWVWWGLVLERVQLDCLDFYSSFQGRDLLQQGPRL